MMAVAIFRLINLMKIMIFSNKGNYFFLRFILTFLVNLKNIINYDILLFVDQTAS